MKGLRWTLPNNEQPANDLTRQAKSPSLQNKAICGLRVPKKLLKEIDRFCEDEDVTRSHVFRRGAKLYIQSLQRTLA